MMRLSMFSQLFNRFNNNQLDLLDNNEGTIELLSYLRVDIRLSIEGKLRR